jgi:hypothetical protein
MAAQRRIPQVERLESRDMPSMLGAPDLAPPLLSAATDAHGSPQVVLVAPASPVSAAAAQALPDLVTPARADENPPPLAVIWQQSADVVVSRLAQRCDPVSTNGPEQAVLGGNASPDDVAGYAHPPCKAADPVAAAAVPSASPRPPTMEVVHRYASKSVGRRRLTDPDDAIQQICLEWLLLAATAATTFDDVRRIVARVIDRDRWRFKKQQRTLELWDVPVHGDPVEAAFRDMQFDRDLGLKDLTEQEWQVVGLRRQGHTFTEIGARVGLRRQRAREMFNVALAYLRRRYRD